MTEATSVDKSKEALQKIIEVWADESYERFTGHGSHHLSESAWRGEVERRTPEVERWISRLTPYFQELQKAGRL